MSEKKQTLRTREPKRRTPKELGVERWHLRRVINLGGSTVVTLPAHLIRWMQQTFSHNWWKPGSRVLVALTPEGDFVIRWTSEMNREEFGWLDANEISNMDHYQMPKKPRRRQINKHTRNGGVKKVWVDWEDER